MEAQLAAASEEGQGRYEALAAMLLQVRGCGAPVGIPLAWPACKLL